MMNRLFFVLIILLLPVLCSTHFKYEDINLNGEWDPAENLAISKPSDKYITIGGAVTEVVFNLGFGNSVIAVDQSSTKPERVKNLPDVGYIRMISSEKILSKTPKKVFTTTSMSPKIAIEQLKTSPLDFMIYKSPKNINDTFMLVDLISQDLGVTELGKVLKDRMNVTIRSIENIKNSLKSKSKIAFFMNPQSGSYVAAGSTTNADYLINFIGGENIFSGDFNSYQKVSEESILIKNPDVILVAAYESKNSAYDYFSDNKNFQYINAFKNNKIIEIQMSDLVMGTSFPDNALELLKIMNSDAK